MAGPSRDPSPLRGPLLAGLGAAVLLVAGTGALAWLAGGEPGPAGATADISTREPIVVAEAVAEPVDPFAQASAEEVSLPGVTDTETALEAAPAQPAPQTRGPRAPVTGLYEPGPGGPLPIIAADGRRPDSVYAKAFDGVTDAPTISVIVGGLGLSRSLTQRAIDTLPSEVTLSFAAYSDNLQDWIDAARADGHEVLIELPMEPFDYPNNDPGPHTLLAEAGPEENRRRLVTLLARGAGYAGVANYLGARIGAAQEPLTGVFADLEARGLSIFHDGSGRRPVLEGAAETAGAKLALADRILDGDPDPASIDARLLELEALALQNGTALGSGFAYPATVDTVAAWADALASRGYQLAPASYLMTLRQAESGPET
jgi:polysaccharide deacetylase 2 family uncharacterized protein YibQ